MHLIRCGRAAEAFLFPLTGKRAARCGDQNSSADELTNGQESVVGGREIYGTAEIRPQKANLTQKRAITGGDGKDMKR